MAPELAIDIPAFCTTQLHLLEHELATSLLETSAQLANSTPTGLQRAGLAITNLVTVSQRTGLGGKTIVELMSDTATGGKGEIPTTGMRVGDIVVLAEQPAGTARKSELRELEQKGVRGVISRIAISRLSIALDHGEVIGSSDERYARDQILVGQRRLWVTKLADEVTHKRMKGVMERLGRMEEREYSNLIRTLFGLDGLLPVDDIGEIEWTDKSLNESQKEAVRFALGSPNVALIHGPPGTGKTHTLIELIIQMLKRQQRILVCGPSNISVDNIVERLAPHKVPIVRLGHPARLLPSVISSSLEVLTQNSDAAGIVKDIRKEIDYKQTSLRKAKSGKERKQIYADLKDLRKEFTQREKKVVKTLLGGCKVVLATLHGSGSFNMKGEVFDVVIIDEASQALEAQCWVPLLSAKKMVLAGDHLQLPPTIKSLNSKIKLKPEDTHGVIKGITLETTLFSRLLKLHGPKIKRMLIVQYRMHEKIMRFPSDELYESKLIADEAVKDRILATLPYRIEKTEDTTEPLIFFDTQGDNFPEKNEEESIERKLGKGIMGESKSNDMEVALVRFHVKNLVNAGVKTEDIAIITPYNAQLALLTQSLKELFHGIELGSIDGFQGREKEAVIISLVRSNPKREVGFLADKRRLNVAITRPRRSLTVIGDSETLRTDKFFARWMNFLEENSDLRYPSLEMLN